MTSRGDFDSLNLSTWDRQMIESAFQAVESVPGGWEFLKTYNPGEGGFMFSNPPPKMKEINDAVIKGYEGHSGASYGGTMRVLEFIAKQGWDAYVKQQNDHHAYIEKEKAMQEKRKQFLELPTNMTLEEQVKALEEFKDVPMTYSEIRERFG